MKFSSVGISWDKKFEVPPPANESNFKFCGVFRGKVAKKNYIF